MVCNRLKTFPCSLAYESTLPTSSADEDNAMYLLVTIGTLVLLALVVVLFFKFRKAIFVLSIPAGITVATVAAILTRKSVLVWPIIAVSCFHIVLGSYVLLIFSFYFIFKPYYIIMVLNWLFNTLHTEKTPSYYAQCTGIYVFLTVFLTYSIWQAHVSYRFKRLLSQRSVLNQPTVLIVNKPPVF